MSRKSFFLWLGLMAAAPGCHEMQSAAISTKNHCWSQMAWSQVSCNYSNEPKPIRKNFGDGWRRGYYDVAGGASGKIPLFPPVKYWGACKGNPLGHSEMDAWFAGYREGAAAAQADNVGFWVQIPMSHDPVALKRSHIEEAIRAIHQAEQVPAPRPNDENGPPAPEGPLPAPEILPPSKQPNSTAVPDDSVLRR
jgi:hypothetical protein